MAVDHEAKRARAVSYRNIAGRGFIYRCANCGWAPGEAHGPVAHPNCYNCKYDLYQDAAEGAKFTEAELLHIQVWQLKFTLMGNHQRTRSIIVGLRTGEMEPPFRTEHLEAWIGQAMRSDEEERAVNWRLKETWKDYDR